MNTPIGLFGALAVAVGLTSAPFPRRESEPAQAATTSPCTADSSYQRLAFWVGDWDVSDSTGKPYATQRVRAVIDECAITAEWTSGGGNKGMGLSAFDMKTREWKQIYVSNQIPFRSGVTLRTSDPSYTGPGIRFIPLPDPTAGNSVQTRVTIMPLSGHRALQEFEDSRDGGKTWTVVFKGEHRIRLIPAMSPRGPNPLAYWLTTAIASIENNSPRGNCTIGVDLTGGAIGKNSSNSALSNGNASGSATKHVTLITRARLDPASSRTACRFLNA